MARQPKQRISIFEETENLDVGSFAPKTATDVNAPRPEQVRAVAQAAQFKSREPSAQNQDAQSKRPRRWHRTGRNVQLTVKASRETVDAVYAISDAKGWVMGYTLERAIEALHRELSSQA